MVVVGIHIIWTTYGTWLPGDARGHWSPLFDFYGRLIRDGHRLNVPDKKTHMVARTLLKEPPKVLAPAEMEIVADVIGNIAGGIAIPGRTAGKPAAMCGVHALAIEPTHVHLLIGPLREDLSDTVGRIKGISSSLIGGLPQNSKRSRTWTASFWRVFLYEPRSFGAVRDYVEAHNVRAAKPPAPWPFTRPK